MARSKFPSSSNSLDNLCKRFSIDNSKRKKHTAIIDCELLSKIYINLIDQKEPRLNLSNENSDNQIFNKENMSYEKKIISPSADEINKHKEFLKKNLKKNFF